MSHQYQSRNSFTLFLKSSITKLNPNFRMCLQEINTSIRYLWSRHQLNIHTLVMYVLNLKKIKKKNLLYICKYNFITSKFKIMHTHSLFLFNHNYLPNAKYIPYGDCHSFFSNIFQVFKSTPF